MNLGHDRASVIRGSAYPVATLRCVSDHLDPSGAAADDPAGTDDDYMADEQYREAVVDLLGALAYGELTAFERLADEDVCYLTTTGRKSGTPHEIEI